MNKIIFWEPVISPHKVHFVSEVAKLFKNWNVIYVAHSDMGEDRKRLGWMSGDQEERLCFELIISPAQAEILCLANMSGAIHVFSGIRWVPTIISALHIVIRRSAIFFIMSEPRVSEGVTGFFRRVHSWLTERTLRNKVSMVLAIGAHGTSWFRSVGYDSGRLYPFGYFVPPPVARFTERYSYERILKVGYLGRLVDAKGVGVLLRMLDDFNDEFNFVFAGTGSLKDKIILKSQNSDRVQYVGVIRMSDVGEFLSNLDILVLPSITTDDGWGVVVSEALMVGTAVVVSSVVGSSLAVAGRSYLGKVCKAGSTKEILDAIKSIENQGYISDEYRNIRKEWAIENLSHMAGARYFKNIVDVVAGAAANVPTWPSDIDVI
jgi:glycosyltransferase involved in cell wall biosynthesis